MKYVNLDLMTPLLNKVKKEVVENHREDTADNRLIVESTEIVIETIIDIAEVLPSVWKLSETHTPEAEGEYLVKVKEGDFYCNELARYDFKYGWGKRSEEKWDVRNVAAWMAIPDK